MLFAKVITPASIEEITKLNGGMRPADETLNDNTFFVYSDAPNVYCDIVSRSTFEREYRWLDRTPNDNAIRKA